MDIDKTKQRVEAKGLTKRYPGALALNSVSVDVNGGEVVAVIGENGAGKSTLMKILAGVQTADSGEVLLNDTPISIRSVRDATQFGISLIHQELNLADNLSVGANMFLGREPRRGLFFDRAAIRDAAKVYLNRIGLDVDPEDSLVDMPIGKQQMVEIAKALSANARTLIFDEPTSSLSQNETEKLYAVIDQLRSEGVGILYISHRLGEVKRLADRVFALRDGINAGSLNRDEISHDRMVRLMVGRDLSQFYERIPHQPGADVLEVNKLRTPVHPNHEVTFSVRAGEIVGLAGLVGAGRTETLRCLFGVDTPIGGDLRLRGEPFEPKSPRDAMDAGIALAPEDRKAHGVILPASVSRNLSLASLDQRQSKGFIDFSGEKKLVDKLVDQLQVKISSVTQPAESLSGGNQQKLVIGKWLALKPSLLLMDEPTRGIDIGAKREIYHLMEELAANGVAILFASSEMEEILGMSDRVLVMCEGQISGELQRDELSEEAIMRLATSTQPRAESSLA